MAKGNFYAAHSVELRRRLKAAIPRDRLRELHERRPAMHFLVVARHLTISALCVAALWQSTWPWLWILAAPLLGACLLGFTVILHEQVHENIFRGSHPRLEALLGRLYGLPVNLSPTQFKRWHLDHHAELGHPDDDPKRANLSPARNSRRVKLLYASPWLFVIYGGAALREARGYPEPIRRRIRFERITGTLFHVALLGSLLAFAGGWIALRVYVLPLFVFFPIAFTLNRLGQHYDIDPERPANWSTLVPGNPFWRLLFVWANFHIEHHYFPRVPFYNLTRLHRALLPFYEAERIPARGYGELLWAWLGKNRRAHTDWRIDTQ